MKKKITTLAFFIAIWGAYSQTGIGTRVPNVSSELDVVSNDKGILIPRVALTSTQDIKTITGNDGNGYENSLLVFNTLTQNDMTPGYYYWYQDKWMRILDQEALEHYFTTYGGNINYDGNSFTYIDENGQMVSLDMTTIIQGNETVTTLVKDPLNNGKYTYTNEAGAAVIIDVQTDVVNNFEEIINKTEVQELLTQVVNNVGGNMTYDGTGFTYTDENGASQAIDLTALIQAGETLTVLGVDTVTGSLTYTDEKGDTTNLDVQALVGKEDLTLSEELEFYASTDGVGKLLAPASIRIADGGVTTAKLGSKAVDASKMNAEASLVGMVPTATGENGKVEYKAVPRFFYMPSVIFATSTLATGLKRDLYQDYVNQFTGGAAGAANATYFISHGATGGSMPYSGGLIKNPGATSPDIVIYNKNQMDYYITYYDTSVLANLKLNNNGVLTYDIIGNATATSYMNIVFVIK